MGRTVAIIQARMGSQRLPGKVLREIEGQSMLERVVRRVQRSRLVDETVVATSVSRADDEILTACERLRVASMRGSEDDVLDRYRAAALLHEAEVCVRVCADSPFVDPGVCDLAVTALRDADGGADYASNKTDPTYPLGLDVEVFTFAALERTWNEARDPYERSHVTVHMRESPAAYRQVAVRDAVDRHSWRWTVDTADDLEFARQVFQRLHGSNNFGYMDVVRLIEWEPDLARINAHVRGKGVTDG